MTNSTIAQVLAAANGEIVGRVRLQKIVYLLEQLGLGSGFRYTYHHYGPYSEDVFVATQREEFLDKSISETVSPSSYGGSYSVFKLVNNIQPTCVGLLEVDNAREFTSKMMSVNSVVLELAATIHWLKEKERISDWRNELTSRKPNKASQLNVDRAAALLSSLGLAA
jgi:uncharacterized protein